MAGADQFEPRVTESGKRDLEQQIDKLEASNLLLNAGARQAQVRCILVAACRETTDSCCPDYYCPRAEGVLGFGKLGDFLIVVAIVVRIAHHPNV